MLVLLHAYTKGFTAMEVSVMFALYELCGAGTNLAAGVVGAKWGIRVTLIAGLLLQIVGLSALYAWNDKWSKLDAIVYVTFAQVSISQSPHSASLIALLAPEGTITGCLLPCLFTRTHYERLKLSFLSQALCGVAKDLVKLGGKTVTKLITPEEKQEQRLCLT
jgi:MFS family permease